MSRLSRTCLGGLLLLAVFAALSASAPAESLKNGSHIYSEKKRYTEIFNPNTKKTEVFCEEDTAYVNERGETSAWSWILCGTGAVEPEPCGSPEANAGEIKFNNLSTKVANVNFAEDELGVELKPAKGSKVLTSYACGSTKYELKGAVIGQVTPVGVPVSPSERFTIEFNEEEGLQSITHFERKTKDVGLKLRRIEGKHKSAWEPVVLLTTEYVEPPETTELTLEKPKK